MRLVQFSDLHLCADPATVWRGWPVQQCWEQALAQALALKPDVLLLTGDLSQDASIAAYRRLATALAGSGLACLAIPGNHDIPHRLRAELGTACALDASRLGNWSALLLDTTIEGEEGGRLAPRTLRRVREWLAGLNGPGLLALHHPPLAVGSEWLDAIGLSNGDELMAQLQCHPHSIIVLFGHAHQQFAARAGSALLLGCPATCRPFRPRCPRFADDPLPPGFRVLDLAADGGCSSHIVRLDNLSDFNGKFPTFSVSDF